MLKPKVFTIGDNQLSYIGYTLGERWKHYDVPYFDLETSIKIVEEYNKYANHPIIYSIIYNTFRIDNEVYKAKEFKTAEGIKKLYPIGAWTWEWEEFTEGNVDSLAEGIEEWLWEFDTYEYNDIYDDRVNVAEELKNQLKDLKTLTEAIRIYYGNLTAEETYNALREEFKL
jgi:hypothetical protein